MGPVGRGGAGVRLKASSYSRPNELQHATAAYCHGSQFTLSRDDIRPAAALNECMGMRHGHEGLHLVWSRPGSELVPPHNELDREAMSELVADVQAFRRRQRFRLVRGLPDASARSVA